MPNDIIDGLKTALGAQDTDIPPEVVKTVFKKFSFLEPEDVDSLIKQITNTMKKNADNPSDSDSGYRWVPRSEVEGNKIQ